MEIYKIREKTKMKKLINKVTFNLKKQVQYFEENSNEIEVKKCEMDEFWRRILDDEEIFSHRGKLYRFARECNPAEWKERGLGDIKILKTKNQRYRIVMRREQVHNDKAVCANHYISSAMALKPQAHNDKAWVWTAMDFGDPDEPNGKYEQFCIKFKNAEIAGNFKEAFESGQNAVVDSGNFTPDRDVSGEA